MRPHGSRRIAQFIVGPRFARTRSAMLLTMRVKPVARMSESDMRGMTIIPDIASLIQATHAREGKERNHTGKLSCFLAGISTFFPRSIAKARAMRLRVECGMTTSSL